ncbi:SDR family oxidoreductase [Rhodococcoides corynebacterioides]|uniref:SDR family oxidoreductase n=1 Tax=Rhodococcoides corynebacterioides TaxID=53972 RepID=UPI001C9AEC7C|nr:SDR family oxidoreductase [Rhodococcus corynebacterioides]MBY6351937.1 SDR family oxidoreductase [Rhodococcus corynebacterioides]
MSRIAIVGGHGKIALKLAKLLTESGHEVSSLIRNPDQTPDIEKVGATAVVADVENQTTVQIAGTIADHDAVVFAAGAGGGNPDRTYAVDRDAAIRTVDAAQSAGVSRFLLVSYFGAGPDHGVEPDNSFYAYAEAKAEADQHLKNSDLDWTIVAPSSLTDDAGTGSIRTKEQGATGETVSRDDVAAVLAAALDTLSTSRRMIEFDQGDTPIADALA